VKLYFGLILLLERLNATHGGNKKDGIKYGIELVK
jgi:hypothetical protein